MLEALRTIRVRWILAVSLGAWLGLWLDGCGHRPAIAQPSEVAQVSAQDCASARHYPVQVLRIVDGDTYDVAASLGFGVSIRIMVRLHGIDTPEMDTPEGKAAREAAIRILESGMVTIRPTGQQTFARWVADVWVGGVSVAEALDKRGHRKKAKP